MSNIHHAFQSDEPQASRDSGVSDCFLQLTVNGHQVTVPDGSVVAAAIAIAGANAYHHSVSGEGRAPLCGMGICFECRATINGHQHCLSCQTLCAEGMTVVTT